MRRVRVKWLKKFAKRVGLTLKQAKRVWMSMPHKDRGIVSKFELSNVTQENK